MQIMVEIGEWKAELKRHRYLILVSILFLIVALLLNNAAGDYTNRAEVSSVPDFILDHLPAVDLSFLFIWGYAFVIAAIFFYPLLFRVRMFHIAISQFSLLVLIRSFFVSLTHLALPANAIFIETPKIFNFLVFPNALFFSGHTAIPFLGFLLFRKEKIGILFLIFTFVMAATVLLMHVHYSIDVFAAFFITYGSYKLGEWFFKRFNGKE